jgi:predicted metal-dependent hydrolase
MESFSLDNGTAVPVEYVNRIRQKNIRIRIKTDRIVVSAPHTCSRSRMQSFLKSQQDWVGKTHSKMLEKRHAARQMNRFGKGQLLLRGEWKPMIPGHSNGIRTLHETTDVLIYPGHIEYGSPDFYAAVTFFYRQTALKELPRRLEQIAATHSFSYKKVYIRSQKTKWGTCSSKGNLSFNWRLIKCPVRIWDYLFIHELSHLVHFNHSPAFWKEVAGRYPDWKQAEQWIKQNNLLLFSEP